MEESMKNYESEFNYVRNKLEKLQKVKELSEKHCQRLENIKADKRRMSEELREVIYQ